MRKIAVIEPKEREALFRNTSAKMGVSEAVIRSYLNLFVISLPHRKV